MQFATATHWVARLSEAKRQGSLEAELRRLSFIPLIVVDEVGYIPFDPAAANLMFIGKPIAMDEGLRFTIHEGGRTVGSGRVVKISK